MQWRSVVTSGLACQPNGIRDRAYGVCEGVVGPVCLSSTLPFSFGALPSAVVMVLWVHTYNSERDEAIPRRMSRTKRLSCTRLDGRPAGGGGGDLSRCNCRRCVF